MTAPSKRSAVRSYLQKVYKLVSTMGHQPINGYCCLDHFVLVNGIFMRPCPKRHWPASAVQGPVGECFRNAALLAFENPGLIYCEGYAMSLLPVLHAWVVTSKGRVIDITWSRRGTEYYGVAIRTDYLRQQVKKQKTYGLIDQPVYDWPLLRAPVKQWRHPIMEAI